MNIGDLNRRFERDAEFGAWPLVSGPAMTPAGSANVDLSLRYCSEDPKQRPAVRRFRRFVIFWGGDARRWVELSTVDFHHLFSRGKLTLAWGR